MISLDRVNFSYVLFRDEFDNLVSLRDSDAEACSIMIDWANGLIKSFYSFGFGSGEEDEIGDSVDDLYHYKESLTVLKEVLKDVR